jgi:hypothetical protein
MNSRVYFMRPVGEAGPVKIGFSTTPESRLAAYMPWSPLPLEIAASLPGGRGLEGRFHARFSAQHLHHEWFAASADLTATIAAIRAGAFDVASLPPSIQLGARGRWNDARRAYAGAVFKLYWLGKRGVPIPDDVKNASYGRWPPEETKRRRQLVIDFVASQGAA